MNAVGIALVVLLIVTMISVSLMAGFIAACIRYRKLVKTQLKYIDELREKVGYYQKTITNHNEYNMCEGCMEIDCRKCKRWGK